jgi:hypothetical protein
MDTDMKKTLSSTKIKPAKTKAAPKLKDLKPQHNPKGGIASLNPRLAGQDINHNETLVRDSNR